MSDMRKAGAGAGNDWALEPLISKSSWWGVPGVFLFWDTPV